MEVRPTPPPAASASRRKRAGKSSFLRRHRELNSLVCELEEIPSGVDPGEDGIGAQLEEMNTSEVELARTISLDLRKKHDQLHSTRLRLEAEVGQLDDRVGELRMLGPSTEKAALSDTEVQLKRLVTEIESTESQSAEKHGVTLMYRHMQQRLQKQLMECERTGKSVAAELRKVGKDCTDAFEAVKRVKQQQLDLSHLLHKVETQLEDGRYRRAFKNQEMDRAIEDSSIFFRKYNVEMEGGGQTDDADDDQPRKVASPGTANSKGDEVDQMDSLAEAFAKIRAATGLSDVNAIVHKFLNREDTHMSLQKASDAATQKIESLKKEQIDLKNQLSAMQNTGLTAVGNRELYKEVDKYDQRLKVALKRSDDSRTKFVSLKLLLEESRVGIAKFLTLLEGQAGQSGPGRSPTVALPSIPAIPEALSEVETKIAGILDAVRLVIQDDSSSKRGYSNSMSQGGGTPRSSSRGLGQSLDSVSGTGFGGSEVFITSSVALDEKEEEAGKVFVAEAADDIIYQSMMTLQPDVSDKNVRVPCIGDDLSVGGAPSATMLPGGNSVSNENDIDEYEQVALERQTQKKLSGMIVSKTQKKTRHKRVPGSEKADRADKPDVPTK